MGGYAGLALRADLSKGSSTIGARLDNLLDVRGDSFAFGNPFSVRQHRQFTPVRPRSFILSLTQRL